MNNILQIRCTQEILVFRMPVFVDIIIGQIFGKKSCEQQFVQQCGLTWVRGQQFMTPLSDQAMLVISLLPHIVYCDQLTSVSTLSSSSQQDNAHKGRLKVSKEQLMNIGALVFLSSLQIKGK